MIKPAHVALVIALSASLSPILLSAQPGGTEVNNASPHSTIPILHPQPPSTLLPPRSTAFELTLETKTPTSCGYVVGAPLPFEQVIPFDHGSGTTAHRTRVEGLDPDPDVVNDVYVRCAAQPDYLLHLQYRSLADVDPPYPRTGNLWGWGQWIGRGLPHLAKVDLWLGASPRPAQIRELRRLNPQIRILTSINAVENDGLADEYYLRDIHGRRIEVWPGAYRLNLTKPMVAEYQARYAYQTVLDTGLLADGVFFDNVMTTQSWQNHDIFGNPVQIDADEDGVPDDPDAFDAAWKAGVFHEIRTFRELLPHAVVSGHAMNIDEPGIGELFNGISIGFSTADVLEGEKSFAALWSRYQDWFRRARSPVTVMVESSPVDQIAYGYDYSPLKKIPPSTLEFARTYYPVVRFGLAFTLLHDGYFAHEYGDTWHGNDWWYDELDFDLGYPLGPAQRVELPGDPSPDLIVNGGFEQPITDPWQLRVSTGCTARLSRQTNDAPAGAACARVDITATTGTDWHVALVQDQRAFRKGVDYDVRFRARSSAGRSFTLSAQKNSPDWRSYGLSQRVWLTQQWQPYTVSFTAAETVNDARLQFFLGANVGTVWIDDVRVTEHPPDLWRRDFTRGIVLLNATRESRDLILEPGLSRFQGTEAPMHEQIVDDLAPTFSTRGAWTNAAYDSGEWKAAGPFYHSWAGSLHVRSDSSGEARWTLPIDDKDDYEIFAWWPAAPEAGNWTTKAQYEVVAHGVIVASATLDQTENGDQWHAIATTTLRPDDNASVRLTAPSGMCVADALYLRSARRFNNGQPATRLRLQPMDGILLRRDEPMARSPNPARP